MATISFRAELDDYTNRVLGVIKEKFGLRDKSQALNRFAELYGEDFVDKEVKAEFIAEMQAILQSHAKKHLHRKLALKELDKLTGV